MKKEKLFLTMPQTIRAAGIASLLLMLGSGSVFAQNTLHTWIGGASTVWTNAANWSDGIVPQTTNDDARVDNNPEQSSVAVYTVMNGAAISNGTLDNRPRRCGHLRQGERPGRRNPLFRRLAEQCRHVHDRWIGVWHVARFKPVRDVRPSRGGA